ncbi:hypothetical protein EYF80_054268 [Liparis tanakae]|uniref:Uncharacterized protein n=1 Tax=Liparis tanakae TaxID=230148 RepID=A0A4Z2F486_9TELE|nr:hypothetical protein EYF80_054268 [Liparis tanakae]
MSAPIQATCDSRSSRSRRSRQSRQSSRSSRSRQSSQSSQSRRRDSHLFNKNAFVSRAYRGVSKTHASLRLPCQHVGPFESSHKPVERRVQSTQNRERPGANSPTSSPAPSRAHCVLLIVRPLECADDAGFSRSGPGS